MLRSHGTRLGAVKCKGYRAGTGRASAGSLGGPGKSPIMPWSHFTKGAFPGCSRAVFGRFLAVPHGTRGGPDRVPSILFTPGGPRVTFNINLKVIRARARNIPRFKPVICPAGTRRGPFRDPLGTRGQFLKENTQGTRPGPLRDPCGSLLGPDLACRGPGRCFAGAFTMPQRVLVGPLYNLQGYTY